MRCALPWLLSLGAGCADLDLFVFNPIHCSIVSEETCTAYDDAWNNACVPCEDPYDFGIDYPWVEGMLAEGQGVRAIDPALIEPLSLPTADGEGTLDAYFIYAHGGDPTTSGMTVVYNHGNYIGIEHYLPRLRVLHEAGYNLLVWDYRGYGKSQPDTTPTPEQHLSDARLVLEEAQARAPHPDRVISYGYSVGSLSATEMAVSGEVCALILEAPFTSMFRVARSNSGLSLRERFFSSGDWDNFGRMARYGGPAFGMVGTLDSQFPPEDVTALLQTGEGPREVWVLEGVDHGIPVGVVEAGMESYVDRLSGWLEDSCL